MLRQADKFIIGTETAQFYEALAPKPEEITVYKHRVRHSRQRPTDDPPLPEHHQLVLFGIATSGIVLSTLRQASDLDYRCVVVKDCCFDGMRKSIAS